jgi:hypothetical protein
MVNIAEADTEERNTEPRHPCIVSMYDETHVSLKEQEVTTTDEVR